MSKTLEFSTVGRDSKSIILNPPLLVEYETILDDNEVFISYDFSLTNMCGLEYKSYNFPCELSSRFYFVQILI